MKKLMEKCIGTCLFSDKLFKLGLNLILSNSLFQSPLVGVLGRGMGGYAGVTYLPALPKISPVLLSSTHAPKVVKNIGCPLNLVVCPDFRMHLKNFQRIPIFMNKQTFVSATMVTNQKKK